MIGYFRFSQISEPSVSAAPATPFRTRGAIDAFLPDDNLLGFALIAGGSSGIGVDFNVTSLAAPDESPRRVAPIDTFLIGKYEATVAEYKACVDGGGCHPSDQRATDGPPERPVRYITWGEALEYCKWLLGKLPSILKQRTLLTASAARAIDSTTPALLGDLLREGLVVSLPSEFEWERAAAGVSGQTYPWFGPFTPLRANSSLAGRLAPSGVGEFSAGVNEAGLFDLSGNVAEWTRSEYQPYPYDPNDNREDLVKNAATRVIRGGSFYDGPSLLRTTARQAADPRRGYDFVGFRVVLSKGVRAGVPTQQQRPSGAAAK
jgi:formylglycine-generating enzyme required for sulfatase activity